MNNYSLLLNKTINSSSPEESYNIFKTYLTKLNLLSKENILNMFSKGYYSDDGFIVSYGNNITIDDIIRIISKYFKTTKEEILFHNKSRKREYVYIRQIICYYSFRHTKLTLKKIGKIIGKDHATVLHSIKTITIFKNSNEIEIINDINNLDTYFMNYKPTNRYLRYQ